MNDREYGQKLDRRSISRLLADTFATTADELQCDAVDTQMVLCAEALLDERQAAQRYPALFRHFHVCPDCRAEYNLLVQLAQMQRAGEFAQAPAIPAIPALITPVTTIVATAWPQRLVSILFPGFVPTLAGATVRGSNDFAFLPVMVHLGDDDRLQIEFAIAPSTIQPALRSLYCTITSSDPTLLATSARIWLATDDSPRRQQEQQLIDTDEIVFDELAPGRYHLHFALSEQEYVVNAIDLP